MYVRVFCDDDSLKITTRLPSGNTLFTCLLGDMGGAIFTVGKMMDEMQGELLTHPLSRRWESTNRLINLPISM